MLFKCMWVLEWEQVDLLTLFLNQTFDIVQLNNAAVLKLYTDFIPFFICEILLGTEIYSHYSVAGIYDMIRRPRRKLWFFKESAELFIQLLFLSFLLQVTGILWTGCMGKLTGVSPQLITPILSEILIAALFLWIHCMVINIISLRKDSRYGFGIAALVQMAEIFLVSLFGSEGRLSLERLAQSNPVIVKLMKCNPVCHILPGIHGTEGGILENIYMISFPMWESVVYMLVLSVPVLLIGAVVVEKTELLNER